MPHLNGITFALVFSFLVNAIANREGIAPTRYYITLWVVTCMYLRYTFQHIGSFQDFHLKSISVYTKCYSSPSFQSLVPQGTSPPPACNLDTGVSFMESDSYCSAFQSCISDSKSHVSFFELNNYFSPSVDPRWTFVLLSTQFLLTTLSYLYQNYT